MYPGERCNSALNASCDSKRARVSTLAVPSVKIQEVSRGSVPNDPPLAGFLLDPLLSSEAAA
jgi:hypothetical protein